MKKPFIFIAFLMATITLFAQKDLNKNITPLTLKDGRVSILQLAPIVNEMGMNKIVGLGEGTHGTKEFNELRIDIIKELIEKKGFRIICFENAFGDSYYFNELINSSESIKDGMKRYLLSLWQTKELEDLFEWVRLYNKTHTEKVSISGMDFNYLANSAKIIKSESERLKLEQLYSLADDFYNQAIVYDSVWNNQMKGLDRAGMIALFRELKSKLQQIDSIVTTSNLQVSDLLQTALLSGKSWSAGERNRDKTMARMAVQIAKNTKMVIWAHAVHLALRSPFKDNSVGGCGGYIKQQVAEYYSMATGTVAGKYGGFEERFNTRTNVMNVYELPPIKKPSWEDYFVQRKTQAFFIDLRRSKDDTLLPLRLIGYGPPKSISYSDEMTLSASFDSYIFIQQTNAPDYLP